MFQKVPYFNRLLRLNYALFTLNKIDFTSMYLRYYTKSNNIYAYLRLTRHCIYQE